LTVEPFVLLLENFVDSKVDEPQFRSPAYFNQRERERERERSKEREAERESARESARERELESKRGCAGCQPGELILANERIGEALRSVCALLAQADHKPSIAPSPM